MADPSEDFLVLNGRRVSSETLRPLPTPPPPPKPRRWWVRLVLRYPILAYVLVVGGIGGVLSNYWQPLEKHFPKLNEFIHSDVTDKNDVDYQLFKLKESERNYNSGIAVCDDQNVSFASCRSAILASKPALADMSNRIDKLEAAWQKEMRQGSMPEVCKQSGSRVYAAFREYVTQEESVSALLEKTDPKSEASVAETGKELDSATAAEDAAVKELKDLPPWPKECAGY